ncbi:hypothetical protein A0128_16925 [Leptospira tipperaryensis]|uniref:Lipoprotein n=1 Tax=Leptospira tipperaryensis TaxID=2564040 RepID=A0A1D7V0L0_9LEPT|nr:hypothetical protein [Leptospira tipperaryensis]AOP35374.1 hypothetical protein A0128_16925 [Leptospira tipperaryensis]
MKKHTTKLVALLVLTMLLSACKKDKDDNTATTALLFLLDQTSGNCAVVQRTNSTLFSASLSVIPKGGCNQATIVGSTLAANTLITQANYDVAQTLATSLGCNANTSNALTNAKNAAATANATASAQTTFDTNAEKTRYFPIADLRIEGLVALNTALSPLGFSQAEILALKTVSVDLIKTLAPLSFLTIAATGAGDAACVTAAGNKITTDFAGVYGFDQTATTKAKISKLAQIQCTYGSGAAANSTCATLNTQF